MSIRNLTLIQFIDNLLLPDLQKMIDNQLHYYAFSIVCQGIELLGAAKDQRPLEEFAESESRFTWALKELFTDIRYRNNQTKFFTFLRGPLIHQLRPGEGFFIASVKKDKIDPKTHLTKHETGALVLIIEPFVDDFKAAVESFKKRVTAAKVSAPERFTGGFITVSDLPPSFGQTTWDPGLNDTVTYTAAATGNANAWSHNQRTESSVD